MIKEAIAKLVDGTSINRQEAHDTLQEIMSGEATEAQIAAFITALRIHGESAEVIAGCTEVMRDNCTYVNPHSDKVVDIVGTGGDGLHSFNISTTSAFVAAGAGITVAKHGNRGVSSKSGAADVCAALGMNIAITPEQMSRCLEDLGIAFLFAPSLHPAMKYAIGPRREIGIRTIFNILGPLSNPAGARYGLLGVYSRELVPLIADALAVLNAGHIFVAHGADGMDEITTTGPTLVSEVKEGQVTSYEISPGDFGLAQATPDDIRGGEAEENAAITRAVLSGQPGPKRDIVLLNSAAAIVAVGKAATLADGIKVAAESIDSGTALAKLEALAALTRSFG
ncbi:MAG: anthranilate phosphoribosyltransferase [Spartobacteria bacterium]|nr:anthranilate phosphoribosyltransferase [Spartobacteria bacterium]